MVQVAGGGDVGSQDGVLGSSQWLSWPPRVNVASGIGMDI